MALNSTTVGNTGNMTNVMGSNLTIEELNDFETKKYLGVLIFCVIVMVIGLIGNTLVLVIYKLKFKRSSARTYIIALAIADVSVCMVGIPYHVLDLTMLLVYKYSYVCKILSFLIGSCTNSSIFILLVVSLDRYMKVYKPFKQKLWRYGDRRACLVAVFFAVLLSIPNGILYGESTVKTDIEGLSGVECFIDDYFIESAGAVAYFGINILIFVLSLLFLCAVYGLIFKKIYQQTKNEGEMNLNKSKRLCCGCIRSQDGDDEDSDNEDVIELTSHKPQGDMAADGMRTDENTPLTDEKQTKNPSVKNGAPNDGKTSAKSTKKNLKNNPSTGMMRHVGNKEKNTRKITLMMLTITVVFAISYLPFIAVSIMDSLDDEFWENMGYSESVLFDWILRFYLLNNAANPIIYSFWEVRFRREIKRLFGFGKPDPKPRNATSTLYSKSTRTTCETC